MEEQRKRRALLWLGPCVAFAALGPYVAIPMLFFHEQIGFALAGAWILLVAAFLIWALMGRLHRIRLGRTRDRHSAPALRSTAPVAFDPQPDGS